MKMLIDCVLMFGWFIGVCLLAAVCYGAWLIAKAIARYIKWLVRRIKSYRDIDYMFKD